MPIYGSIIYGESQQPSNEDIHPYKPDLMRYMPGYYHDSMLMKTILDADADELGKYYYYIEDLFKQLFINSATWGLDIWEKELGLTTDISKTYEERRELIMARLRGVGTITKVLLKNIASAFSGGDVDVIEYPAECRIVIKFIGTKGVPKNMNTFAAMVETVKPAHLAYSFEYTFTWWNKIAELTWAQAGIGTWDDLRIYE